VVRYALSQLEPVLRMAWADLQTVYAEYREKAEPIEERIADAGDDHKAKADAIHELHEVTLPVRDIVSIIQDDWLAFLHSQAYAGTVGEKHFLGIYITDTAYIILSRLLFVRICEDLGMVSPKVSHRGVAIWHEFMGNMPAVYRDLIDAAFKSTRQVYSGLFERTVFDWWAHTNGALSAALERILYRLSAFEFSGLGRDVLGDVYQSFLPAEKRKQLGEFYTDIEVVDYILWRTGITTDPHLAEKRVLDPACGSFTFGVRTAQHILRTGEEAGLPAADLIDRVASVVVGFDVNPFAVFIAQMNLIFAVLPLYQQAKAEDPEYRLPGFQVHWVNSLLYFDQRTTDAEWVARHQPQGLAAAYDYVVGNPPYVRNERVPPEDRGAMDAAFSSIKYKNTDLSAYFIHRAVSRWLKPNGVLGFVVSLGLANSDATSRLRAYLADRTLLEVSSLEWIATELFKGTDIVPMLLFVGPGAPPDGHQVELLQGLASLDEFGELVGDEQKRAATLTRLPQAEWLKVSPFGDWCPEVAGDDLAVLATLRARPTLEKAGWLRTSYGMKAGSGAQWVHEGAPPDGGPTAMPYLKGDSIASWGHSPADAHVLTDHLADMADASIWGCRRVSSEQGSLMPADGPGHDFVALVPKIHPTVNAVVANAMSVCANDSTLVISPRSVSAHTGCAVINSSSSRYVALLALRAGILLRRRSTLYPRTINSLPCPSLTQAQVARLDALSRRAHEVSALIARDAPDLWAELGSQQTDTIRAAQLLNWTGWGEAEVEAGGIEAAELTEDGLRLKPQAVVAGDAATLKLLWWHLLAFAEPPLGRAAPMDIPLPRELATREALVAQIQDACARREDLLSELHEQIEPEIDDIVMDGLGLSSEQKATIRKRCREFPLSETVMRPRYLWSEDRKRQALRRYEKGKRYLQGAAARVSAAVCSRRNATPTLVPLP